jgi:hypothetical protein
MPGVDIVMYKAGNVLSERMIDLNKTDFCDLVERIKDSFMEIDSDIMVDLKKQDIEYADMCQKLGEMESRYPFILEVTEGSGAISLTAEEHEIVRKYMSRMFEKETIERCQIYFRGHTDGYVYLKKIGVV